MKTAKVDDKEIENILKSFDDSEKESAEKQ